MTSRARAGLLHFSPPEPALCGPAGSGECDVRAGSPDAGGVAQGTHRGCLRSRLHKEGGSTVLAGFRALRCLALGSGCARPRGTFPKAPGTIRGSRTGAYSRRANLPVQVFPRGA